MEKRLSQRIEAGTMRRTLRLRVRKRSIKRQRNSSYQLWGGYHLSCHSVPCIRPPRQTPSKINSSSPQPCHRIGTVPRGAVTPSNVSWTHIIKSTTRSTAWPPCRTNPNTVMVSHQVSFNLSC